MNLLYFLGLKENEGYNLTCKKKTLVQHTNQ